MLFECLAMITELLASVLTSPSYFHFHTQATVLHRRGLITYYLTHAALRLGAGISTAKSVQHTLCGDIEIDVWMLTVHLHTVTSGSTPFRNFKRISSRGGDTPDFKCGDVRRIFGGLKFTISRYFWVRKFWQVMGSSDLVGILLCSKHKKTKKKKKKRDPTIPSLDRN